jgi:hypothetical protein
MASNKIISSLIFDIQANSAQLKKGLSQANQQIQGFSKQVNKIGSLIKGAFVATAIIKTAGAIKDFLADSAKLADVQLKAEAKVKQAIETTGGAAGYTAKQLGEMASSLQSISLFGDEQILNDVTAQLLTFTNIAGDEFSRAQQAALDLSTVLGTDLKSTSIQVGKALNDPVKGLTALSRSGIQFSESQKELIKNMVAAGDTAKAQQVILSELEKQYGGQAKIAAETGLAPLQQLKNTWSDIKEEIGKGVIPIVNAFAKMASKAIDYVVKWVKESIKWVVDWINQWINLYNESLAFRLIVESIAGAFKFIWGIAKLVVLSIVDLFKTGGKVIAFAFSPKNWGKDFAKNLNDIYIEGFKKIKQNAIDFGNDTKNNIESSLERLKKGNVKLIDLSKAKDEGLKAGKSFTEGFEEATSSGSKEFKLKPLNSKDYSIKDDIEANKELDEVLKDLNDTTEDNIELTKVQVKTGVNRLEQIKQLSDGFNNISQLAGTISDVASKIFGEEATEQLQEYMAAVQQLMSILSGIASIFETINSIVSIFNTLTGVSTALTDANTVSKEANSASSLKNATASTTEAGADAIGAAAKSGKSVAAIPIIGAALAVAAIAATIAAFVRAKKDAKKNAGGGTMDKTGLSWVGEMGAELLELPAGSRVHSAGRSKQMMNDAGNSVNQVIVLDTKIKGSDIYLTQKEYQKKLSNTR